MVPDVRRPLAAALVVLVAFVASGCTFVRYLAQAANGEAEILMRARPLDEAAHDPANPPRVRALLAEIPKIKAFGERAGLKPTANYQSYSDLGRPAVVWVVSACAPLSFAPKKWSFPIVGTVPYLGWFDKQDAERFAWDLREEGYDVDVRPASAFSTLGFFHDPVLSTMIDEGPEDIGELADVVLHESTHATVYVEGQTAFDEGLASFVGDRLAAIYLDETRGKDSAARRAFVAEEARRTAREAKLHLAYVQLKKIYDSKWPDATKRAEKQLVLSRLRSELAARRPLNNATLFETESYHGGESAFGRLLEACGGDLVKFVAAVKGVTKTEFDDVQQRDLRPVVGRLISRCAAH